MISQQKLCCLFLRQSSDKTVLPGIIRPRVGIYWQPDASGTGVEPVYVMLSSPYGETNAKGKYSGRDYNTDKAGGPVRELSWGTATIEQEGETEYRAV